MTWKVFAGEEADLLNALIRVRSEKDGVGTDNEAAGRCLRAHLHRGLAYLASGKETKNIADFLERWPR